MNSKILTFQEHSEFDAVLTYEVWCDFLGNIESDTLSEGIKDQIAKASKDVRDAIVGVFKSIKDEIFTIVKDFGISLKEIVKGLRDRDVYQILRGLKFNVVVLERAFREFRYFWVRGLQSVFKEISENKYIQKIRMGLMTIDEFLDKFPILKKATGPAVGGFLLFMWLNRGFTGRVDYDLDVSDILSALAGKYSFADILASPKGLMTLTIIATGGLGGFVSATWLASSTANIVLALVYTGVRNFEGKLPPVLAQVGKIATLVRGQDIF
jgi:hypothetical protein